MTDFTQWQPDSDWSSEQWIFETRALRNALAALNIHVPHCLPGDPDYCGTPVWMHYGTYAAILKAAAQALIEVNLGSPAPSPVHHYGTVEYQHELEKFLRDVEFGEQAEAPGDDGANA